MVTRVAPQPDQADVQPIQNDAKDDDHRRAAEEYRRFLA